MRTITREEASALIAAWPTTEPSLEPCYVVNFPLWAAWCAARDRDPDPAPHWTEADVVASSRMMLRRFLEQAIERELAS